MLEDTNNVCFDVEGDGDGVILVDWNSWDIKVFVDKIDVEGFSFEETAMELSVGVDNSIGEDDNVIVESSWLNDFVSDDERSISFVDITEILEIINEDDDCISYDAGTTVEE